jgi:hypothetical protein
MKKLDKTFCVSVYRDGSRDLSMNFFPREYDPLSSLALDDFRKPNSVTEVINQIKSVIEGKAKQVFISNTDWCIITVGIIESTVVNGFDEFPPFSIPTTELLLLFEEWLDFILAYENNEIPGLPYPPPSPNKKT